jgi:phosphatidylinositol alpha-1,6-mannosyltransferase
MADVFAMPCPHPRRRPDVEGLGIVYLEASATVPVVAGRSGGAPETVQDGVTGLVANGWDVDEIAAVGEILRSSGRRGWARRRSWAVNNWQWRLRRRDCRAAGRLIVTGATRTTTAPRRRIVFSPLS